MSGTAQLTNIEYSDSYLEQVTSERRDSIRLWLEDYFGERCEEFCEDCIVCQKWAAFDVIFGDLES